MEGNSVRSTERLVGVSRETVLSLLVRGGTACTALLDARMVGLTGTRYELDEIWGFVGKKQRNVTPLDDDYATLGDAWTFVALDADTKLVPSFRVGKRDGETARAFLTDFAKRVVGRPQVSSDGWGPYQTEVPRAFDGAVDFAIIVKEYQATPAGPGRYSPPSVTSSEKTPICGLPVEELVSTSYVERQNLTMRTSMRRLTRLTNGFSKKLDNHVAATALHFAAYNFVKVHQTLRCTPAMAAGVERSLWTMDDLYDAILGAGAP